MTAEVTLIKTAFEEEGMSPEQIAECQELDITAVKACLLQSSSKYRKLAGQGEEEVDDGINFTKDEQRRIKEGILDTALSAEDPHLRFKALTYCRDDFKGRKDITKAVGGMTNNIFMLNEQLAKMRSIKDNIVSSALGNRVKQKAIDV